MKRKEQDLASPARAAASQAKAAPRLWIWRFGPEQPGAWLATECLAEAGMDRPAVEPFGADGAHGALAREWPAGQPKEADDKRLLAAVDAAHAWVIGVADQRPGFHASLVEAAVQDAGSVHVLLHVRDAAKRLAASWSAHPATGIEALLRRDRAGVARLAFLHAALQRAGLTVHRVAIDDLVPGASNAAAAWAALAPVGAGSASASARREPWAARLGVELSTALSQRSESDRALLAREALWATHAEMPVGALLPVVREPAASPVAMRLVRLDRLPALVHEGESLRLGGVVVPPGEPVPDRRLFLRQGPRRQRLVWDLPSPAVAARMPADPAAGQARFKPAVVQAHVRQPVLLMYRPGEKATPQKVAELHFEAAGRPMIEGIYLGPWSIGYQPFPKVACTSIKELLFQLAAGAPFQPSLGAGADHVHRYFDLRVRDVSGASFRFVVVRDPVKRFLSAFSNRVLHHKELSRAYVEKLRLTPPLDLSDFPFDPTLAQFVDRFDLYRRVPTIDHHFRPVSEYTAPLSAFDKVYPFERLDDLVADLQRLTGQRLGLPHSQRGGPKISVKDVPPKVLDRLIELCAPDYRLLEGFYAPSQLR